MAPNYQLELIDLQSYDAMHAVSREKTLLEFNKPVFQLLYHSANPKDTVLDQANMLEAPLEAQQKQHTESTGKQCDGCCTVESLENKWNKWITVP